MASRLSFIIFCLYYTTVLSWEALPNIPSGRRSQYLVLHENGGYKYGYDTGDGNAAKQSGDANNQVEGHYFYKNAAGKLFDLKYTSGVQGFVPEGLDQINSVVGNTIDTKYSPQIQSYSYQSGSNGNAGNSQDDQANTGDASYNFAFDTDTYKRQESSDAQGNVQGRYSYINDAGQHDLQYVAGANKGFVATSGSLATANGLLGRQGYASGASQFPSGASQLAFGGSSYGSGSPSQIPYSSYLPGGFLKSNADGSYAFEYNAGDHAHSQSADPSGNVQGRYSYQNAAGTHDLNYVAGADTGFQVTGGSLATPNGLKNSVGQTSMGYGYPRPLLQTYSGPGATGYNYLPPAYSPRGPPYPGGLFSRGGAPSISSYSSTGSQPDGSYSFSYQTDDSSRQENSDAAGNVQGSYSYKNDAGSHDLSYVAGSATGFQVTGGSLAQPNGIGDSGPAGPGLSGPGLSGPGLSSAEIDPARDSFIRQPETISSSEDETSTDQSSTDDQANTGDASYSFAIDTDDYKRIESSDASGNVQGSFSYKNEAGNHDLSYVAGSGTGFVATGGSLSDPNAIAAKIAGLSPSSSGLSSSSSGLSSSSGVSSSGLQITPSRTYIPSDSSSNDDASDQANTGDASYSFTIDTDDYKRHETSDAQGNVQGGYTYKNSAGQHGLNFVAGSSTGFLLEA